MADFLESSSGSAKENDLLRREHGAAFGIGRGRQPDLVLFDS
jgi:hypothetical protein